MATAVGGRLRGGCSAPLGSVSGENSLSIVTTYDDAARRVAELRHPQVADADDVPSSGIFLQRATRFAEAHVAPQAYMTRRRSITTESAAIGRMFFISTTRGADHHKWTMARSSTATRPSTGGTPRASYFATPHHAWERGTNENTNGLLRQYLPKGASMTDLSQPDCNRIATKLNRRPRKRLGYRTPEKCYVP